MLVPVGTHFVPTGTYFCIFIEHKIELIFKKNELKIEMWKKLNFAAAQPKVFRMKFIQKINRIYRSRRS